MQNIMVMFFIALATFTTTMLGGLFALYLKDRLHLILGFSAGAIIGVAFFDLLPESINLGLGTFGAETILSVAALGFVTYLLLDRLIFLHSHDEEDSHKQRSVIGAGSLSIHSFLDGVGIGLAFQVSSSLGAIVTVAVLAHDFSDGINTVNMIVRSGGDRIKALKWLTLDAIAPVLGIFSTFYFSISDANLALLLSLFSGFFLYIGASDLVPESHHMHPRFWTTFMTVLGVGTLYFLIKLASI